MFNIAARARVAGTRRVKNLAYGRVDAVLDIVLLLSRCGAVT